MSGGIQLQALVDTFLGTSQAVLTGENFVRNERQRHNYLLYRVMKGKDMEDVIQGGDSITDQIILEEDSTYGPYNPLEPREPRLSNHLKEFTIPWATTDAHVTFSKHEKGLNQASRYTRKARAMVFKNIIKAKWSNLIVSINNGMEKEFFAVPDNSTMEATTATGHRVPNSIFCSITSFGASTSDAFPTGTVPPGFSTVQQLSPSTYEKWRNPVEFYADGKAEIYGPAASAGNPQGWDGFGAASVMYDRLRFEQLAIRPEYGETEEPDAFILCSRKGKKLWEDAQRKLNDYTRHGPSNAAYPGLNYNGVPVMWYEGMDTAAVWPGTSGTVNAGENNNTLDPDGNATTDPDFEGPRFVWLVPKYWKKWVHSDHFMEEETPPASVHQPYQRTVYFDCWHQNGTQSRLRGGGVMEPSADIDGYI